MSTVVETPEFQEVWGRIRESHDSRAAQTGPLNLRLYGASGTGKTFALKAYRAAHPPSAVDGQRKVPVLLASIPSSPTASGVWLAVLAGLGVKGATGRVAELQYRALAMIHRCQVQLVMVDELNHLTDRGQLRTRESLADALKVLVDSSECPVVFAGAKRTQQLFDANQQLRSRAMSSLTLQPFNLDDRFDDLKGYVFAVAKSLSSEEIACALAEPLMAMKLFYATDGVQRVLTLFLERIAIALSEPRAELNASLLASLFRRYLWERAPEDLNPFGCDFQMRRLNQPGEPHAPTDLDGDNHDDECSPSPQRRQRR